MFNNRSVKVSLVKDKKVSEENLDQTPTPTPAEYVQLAREAGKDVVIGVGALLGTYIALDTIRQVTIQIVKAKI